MRLPKRTAEQGFSLLEITFVVALILILASMTASHFSSWQAKATEASAVGKLNALRAMVTLINSEPPAQVKDAIYKELACSGPPCVVAGYEYQVSADGSEPLVQARPVSNGASGRMACLSSAGEISMPPLGSSQCSGLGATISSSASGSSDASSCPPADPAKGSRRSRDEGATARWGAARSSGQAGDGSRSECESGNSSNGRRRASR